VAGGEDGDDRGGADAEAGERAALPLGQVSHVARHDLAVGKGVLPPSEASCRQRDPLLDRMSGAGRLDALLRPLEPAPDARLGAVAGSTFGDDHPPDAEPSPESSDQVGDGVGGIRVAERVLGGGADRGEDRVAPAKRALGTSLLRDVEHVPLLV
jgi:hypothetical protein